MFGMCRLRRSCCVGFSNLSCTSTFYRNQLNKDVIFMMSDSFMASKKPCHSFVRSFNFRHLLTITTMF